MIEKTIEGIRSSDQAEIAKTMSESEVYLYTGITGDFNPVPINQVYAEKIFSKSRIAQQGIHMAFQMVYLLSKEECTQSQILLKNL
jgi:hypothetical protein